MQFSPEEEEFALRVRGWLEEKLSGEWAEPARRGRQRQRGAVRRATGLGEGAPPGGLDRPGVAGGVRRAARHPERAHRLRDRVRAGPRAASGGLPGDQPDRADDPRLRHAGAEGPVHPADPRGRGHLVPGLQRAGGGLGPRGSADPRPRRRRRLGDQRPEDLDQPRRRLELDATCSPGPSRTPRSTRASRCCWSRWTHRASKSVRSAT